MRKPVIAGNWKMNTSVEEGIKLVEELKKNVKGDKVEVIVCPPHTHLYSIKEALKGSNIGLGAQNMHFEEKGAFTGEISPLMLKELGVDYVILGHSERREHFNETNESVNKKVRSAIDHGLTPIMCCGESLEQRESGKMEGHIREQIVEGLKNINEEEVANMIIAYEPIWAIGTGKTASDEDAEKTIAFIRSIIKEEKGEEAAQKVRIQYGGSVKASTIKGQMAMENIDGALVGGASLKAEEFSNIVNF